VRSILAALLIICSAAPGVGCARTTYDPAWATRPYPHDLHTTNTVDMQVFRHESKIEIINSTAISYRDFDVWVNQRYVSHVEALPAGESLTLSLWDFKDEYGNCFYAGGFFRTYPATPVRMVEIQRGSDHNLIGLVSIRTEAIAVAPEPGR
jgi:hypothetical protein